MLEFCKEILLKVSFDKRLFKKELYKAIRWCRKEEKVILRAWCLLMFGNQYRDEIIEAFNSVG